MTRARFIRRTALCVVLGLLSTVLIAWVLALAPMMGFAVGSRAEYRVDAGSEVAYVFYQDARAFGRRMRIYGWDVRTLDLRPDLPRIASFDAVSPGWGLGTKGLTARGIPPQPRARGTTVSGTGWPMAALWLAHDEGMMLDEYTGTLVLYQGWPTPPRGAYPAHIALPLLPVWPGLLVDIAAHAMFWGILVWLVSTIRSRRRFRRGHCPKCNYDLQGDPSSGCPECGWGRTESAHGLGANKRTRIRPSGLLPEIFLPPHATGRPRPAAGPLHPQGSAFGRGAPRGRLRTTPGTLRIVPARP